MKPRHAFLVRESALIPPLGAPASEAWVLDAPLYDRTRRMLERAGLVVERVESLADAEAAVARTPAGALVADDSVAFSWPVLKNLLAAFDRGALPALRAALPHSETALKLSHLDGLEPIVVDGAKAFTVPLWVLGPGAKVVEARTIVLPFKEHVQKFPIPVGMIGVDEMSVGVSDSYMVRIDHWAHILRFNQMAIISWWMERWNQPAGRLWMLWRALLGFPWASGRMGASMRQIHPKAKVHHRAYVDGSVIEEGAEIGVNAVVRLSYIGKGARVEDGAVVNATVLGPGAWVASGSTVTGAVLYPRAFAAQHKMQLCVFGEAAVAFTGSYFYDINFTRNVQVAHRGRVVDCGDRFLSVCLGPWSRIAGGVWIAGGREVPAGALIVQPPDGVLYKMDEQLSAQRMVTVDKRAMKDVGELPSNRPGGLPALGPGPTGSGGG